MRIFLICFLICVLCSGCDPAIESRQETNDKNVVAVDVSGIVEGNNQFALELYQQLCSKDGNLFFSPSSISIALAMTYAGAAGETEQEMAKTLHFPMPDGQLHEGMKALQSYWKAPDNTKGFRLNMANRLWGSESYEFLPEFLEITRDHYGAELARLGFAQSEQARETINRWVEEQTENQIADLIPVWAINSNTKLVLTNAVYFQGNWTEPFNKRFTYERDFHLNATDTIKVPTMYILDEYRYCEVATLQILELPYGDGSLSMVVLLPKEVDGIADLEAKLTVQNLQQWTDGLSDKRDVAVYLPKFETTSQFDVSTTLKAMGMESAFDTQTADFSGMTGERGLFISAVVHKAFVNVNEEGTVAAAATGKAIALNFGPPDFRANHPFVFLIQDNRNGSILFMGRVENPME